MTDGAPVLLVDDSPDDRFLAVTCWTRAAIPNPLVSLEDGQKAIDYLAGRGTAGLPALVLLDLKMPVRNGFEVLAWMRARDACRRVPVIMMTASELPGDVEKAYDLGANSFVVKPSSIEDLVELFRALNAWWLRVNVFPPEVGGAQRASALAPV
ncbi:MAG: response regulator [Myxococcota bacterium]